MTTDEKYEKLLEILKSYGSALVAFSGGVDSTFLAKAAHEALKDNMAAGTAVSETFPDRDKDAAAEFCRKEGIRQLVIRTDELSIPEYAANPANRCYYCKKNLFATLQKKAEEEHLSVVCEGSNVDDLGDYRPGLQAIKELGIHSPLREAGLHKQEIRELSKKLGLPTWNKPAAACLASRFVYGERITAKKLSMVGAAEDFLADLGFSQLRVRMHGENLARIEVPAEELEKVLAHREEILTKFTALGFTYITLDLRGYRTGSMNEVLKK